MSFLQKAWAKLKKVPVLGWAVFGVLALVVLVGLFFRGQGRPKSRSSPQGASAPTLTPEQAEEELEKIDEDLAAKNTAIDQKYDQLEENARKRWDEL